ncbi:nucleoside diphosphate kinase B-like [Echinops telfairi]|uniref:Nucleoside diphosphate kinase B-like n=1 Tax=Echinops telfairi TaxID=9371 RepID=A0AC55DDJ8_ECHTE|nr:nucleoside diphosphate kinase B-like [Echinops telfairi]
MANNELTFISVKPDGMQCGVVDDIIKHVEQKGFCLVAMKLVKASEEHLKQHSIDLKDHPFFPGLVKDMNSGPMWPWSGRDECGEDGPGDAGGDQPVADSQPGTIRGDLCSSSFMAVTRTKARRKTSASGLSGGTGGQQVLWL